MRDGRLALVAEVVSEKGGHLAPFVEPSSELVSKVLDFLDLTSTPRA